MSRANVPAHPVKLIEPIEIIRGAPPSMVEVEHSGLTIRERFAMAAMQGIIASGRNTSSVVLDVAAEAREYADALIDELAKEPRS